MHNFRTGAKKKMELVIGKKYQVNGYHTGNFVGECVEVSSTGAVLVVTVKTASLKLGEHVEIPIAYWFMITEV